MYTKEKLIELLTYNIVKLSFKKMGNYNLGFKRIETETGKYRYVRERNYFDKPTLREMRCTLCSSVLKDYIDFYTQGTKSRKDDKHINVFDLDKKSWRSFIVDNVVEIQEVIEVERNPNSKQEYLFSNENT